MREPIQQRFEANIARVRNLVTLYRGAAGEGGGRRPVHSTDMLRAATVLLHATLEDVFRSTAAWKLPTATEHVLNDVPLVGLSNIGRPEKFLLGKLATHRTKTVQQLIDESVKDYLGTFTINNTNDISSFCRKIDVEVNSVNAEFPALSEIIARRHHIVHQADRNDQPGPGNHEARSLSANQVDAWITAVERFTTDFLAQIPA